MFGSPAERQQLARQFAVVYCREAFRNGDLVEETVRTEGFDCDYARQGWVQARDSDQQEMLAEAVEMAIETDTTDWTSITPEEVERRTGMRATHNAGFSVAAASFHPAKWVWSLLRTALDSGTVSFDSRTRVSRVEDVGEEYLVHTSRGTIRARHVVNATEAYTPLLHPQFHDRILPTQTQAASGTGGPEAMQPHTTAGPGASPMAAARATGLRVSPKTDGPFFREGEAPAEPRRDDAATIVATRFPAGADPRDPVERISPVRSACGSAGASPSHPVPHS